jgi:hypothetical protein
MLSAFRGSEAEPVVRNPILGTFPVGCCASVEKQSAKSMAQSAKPTIFDFLLLPVASRLLPVFI